MIDSKHNLVVSKAHDQISAMAKAGDSHELAKLYGVACGYLECLLDNKILPLTGFENLMDLARGAHNTVAQRTGWIVTAGSK